MIIQYCVGAADRQMKDIFADNLRFDGKMVVVFGHFLSHITCCRKQSDSLH